MEHRRVQLHGHDLAYRIAGEGPVILLIHGMAGSGATWESVIPALARHGTVVAPDLPGHGDSAKPHHGDYSLGAFASIARDLMVALDVEHATIVGQSLGGGVAMQFAYQFPARCERLVLVSSGGLGREVTPLLRALAAPGVEYLLPLMCAPVLRDAGRGVLGGLRRIGLRPSAYVDEVWRSYESLAESQTRAAFVRTLRSVVDVTGQTVSAHDRLAMAAAIPTLIVWGERDTIIPVRHAFDAHDSIPGSHVEIIEGVGHFPHCEAPERFANALAEFIDSTTPARIDEHHVATALMGARAEA